MSSTRRLAGIIVGIFVFSFLSVAIISAVIGRESLPTNTVLDIDSVLVPIVEDNLDTFDVAWHLGDGWSHSPINEGGMALVLFGPPNSSTQYGDAQYADIAVALNLRVEAGEARLYVRRSAAGMYAILVDAAGQAKLYRNAVLLGDEPYTIHPSGWNRVRFVSIGGRLRLTINETVIIDINDDLPLPTGTIALDGAGVPVRLVVDDFALAQPN